jgi:hypothetical protein
VPGGFGDRGCEGKIAAVRYARTSRVPLLGVCLGMQCMVIEFARSLGLDGANSTEFNATTPHPVVIFMPEGSKDVMGGTMRLGARTTHVTPTLAGGQPSLAMRIYGAQGAVPDVVCAPCFRVLRIEYVVSRSHLGEAPPPVRGQPRVRRAARGWCWAALVAVRGVRAVDAPSRAVQSAGLLFTGRDDTGQRMEIVELPQVCCWSPRCRCARARRNADDAAADSALRRPCTRTLWALSTIRSISRGRTATGGRRRSSASSLRAAAPRSWSRVCRCPPSPSPSSRCPAARACLSPRPPPWTRPAPSPRRQRAAVLLATERRCVTRRCHCAAFPAVRVTTVCDVCCRNRCLSPSTPSTVLQGSTSRGR